MGIKDAAKRIVYGPKASSETYIPWLRSLGMVIGDNCMVYAPTKTIIDVQHPWMIEMGNNVQITEGVTILTHGYDWSVFKGKYGDVLGSAGHVKIGSNVFIGMNVTILKGTTIGDNVVIGATRSSTRTSRPTVLSWAIPSVSSAPSTSTWRSAVRRR